MPLGCSYTPESYPQFSSVVVVVIPVEVSRLAWEQGQLLTNAVTQMSLAPEPVFLSSSQLLFASPFHLMFTFLEQTLHVFSKINQYNYVISNVRFSPNTDVGW